ncbi:hypothetical protein N7532_006717 [Penicillium argentinense]|uniref:Uncharacterized protein n=1 Tax=Penicillium argentinense TaxID=1131581 RepID=A0A9W9FGG6_9EURO|nr:uncharacterized protein N7532_006717 [Penicillium argentinense]KAJ5099716.1 hypothetical protein N7532_006717 [Penicillium argentinense]
MVPVTIPHMFAGLANYLSGWVLQSYSVIDSPWNWILRFTLMAAWVLLNLFCLDLANQRLDESVQEDFINKPWRPIPTGRLSQREATNLLCIAIPCTLGFSYFSGGFRESVVMAVLNYIYNDCGVANEHFILRNLMNAFGFMDFVAGASRVIAGPQSSFSALGLLWLATVGAFVFSTISIQDLYDQEGDSARNRLTAPLVLGDWKSRIMTAGAIMVCSLTIPPLFGIRSLAVLICWNAMGFTIAVGVLLSRCVKRDKENFTLWCAWLVLLYMLPPLRA